MALPFFYIEQVDQASSLITLNEETSKHVVQVLRMKAGEQLQLTDGKGNLLVAEITEPHKSNCIVKTKSASFTAPATKKVSIAISLVKNANRFEWFLEKATELGVSEIIPLISERTERQHFRYERMKGILVSAMLQSQQTWLPVLHEPVKFQNLMANPFENHQKFIAHCEDGSKQPLSGFEFNNSSDCIILIGPEGDFTTNEIDSALQHHFIPVALGKNRLRTETAGITAAVLLSIQ